MKMLIIGGTSSLGRSLRNILSQFGEVITAGRRDCDIKLDLGDLNAFIDLPLGLDVVINTAAQFGTSSSEEILETEKVNVLGTLRLCQAAVRARVKHFILISSIYSDLRSGERNYTIYSLSKRHAEEVAALYCFTHLLPLTILKPSPLYGNGDRFRKHHPFLYTMIDKARKGEDITLFGSNDPLRNYLHIDDFSEIIYRVALNKVLGTYSCTYTSDVTYSQIARAAYELFQTNGKICHLSEKPDIPDNIFVKDFSLYEKIDFYPKISIDDGMRKLAKEKGFK